MYLSVDIDFSYPNRNEDMLTLKSKILNSIGIDNEYRAKRYQDKNFILQVRSQRHSDCSDQYSVLGDLDHPPPALVEGGGDEEDLLRRRRIGEDEEEERGEGTRWRRTEGGNGRIDGGNGRVEGGNGRMEGGNGRTEGGNGMVEGVKGRTDGRNGRVEGGKGASSDLDFVIDVTQTEPKSMSLQVTLSGHAISATLINTNFLTFCWFLYKFLYNYF